VIAETIYCNPRAFQYGRRVEDAPKQYDADRLTMYLLGQLPEGEQQEIELRFLEDDELYDELASLESELVFDYARGNLPSQQRKLVESHLIVTPRQTRRAYRARLISERLTEPDSLTTVAAARPATADRFRRLLPSALHFGISGFRSGWAAAFLTLLVFVGVLVWQRATLLKENGRLKAAQARLEQTLREQESTERQPGKRPSPDPSQDRDKMAQQGNANAGAEEAAGSARTESPIKPATLSLPLSPGLFRDAEGVSTLTLSSQVDRVRIELRTKRDSDYEAYSAAVRSKEGAQVWSRARLRPRDKAAGRTILITIPARLLTPSSYIVTLRGTTIDGEVDDVAEYYFSVVKGH
jgi:hypothetical protein